MNGLHGSNYPKCNMIHFEMNAKFYEKAIFYIDPLCNFRGGRRGPKKIDNFFFTCSLIFVPKGIQIRGGMGGPGGNSGILAMYEFTDLHFSRKNHGHRFHLFRTYTLKQECVNYKRILHFYCNSRQKKSWILP